MTFTICWRHNYNISTLESYAFNYNLISISTFSLKEPSFFGVSESFAFWRFSKKIEWRPVLGGNNLQAKFIQHHCSIKFSNEHYEHNLCLLRSRPRQVRYIHNPTGLDFYALMLGFGYKLNRPQTSAPPIADWRYPGPFPLQKRAYRRPLLTRPSLRF